LGAAPSWAYTLDILGGNDRNKQCFLTVLMFRNAAKTTNSCISVYDSLASLEGLIASPWILCYHGWCRYKKKRSLAS